MYSVDEPDELPTKTVFGGFETPDGYFHIKKERRLPALKMMRDHGVTAYFAGHWHRNARVQDESVEHVITSAVGVPLGPDKPGFRLVTVSKDRLEHRFLDV